MSRFKRIKNTSTKKSSVSINEKIAALNKELEKTGMLSEINMTTSNAYTQATAVPNQDVSDFESTTHGGQGLGLSAADGNTAGNAILGDASGVSGVALSPPHPVTGVRKIALHVRDGLGGTEPLRPGQVTYRGFGDNPPPYTMGSALWFYDANYNNGEGQWCNLEYGNFENDPGWGFWDTIKTGQFAGVWKFETNTSLHPCGDLSGLIAGLNFPGTGGSLGPPETIVLTHTELGDPLHLPIDIPGLSGEAFNYLNEKAKKEEVELAGGNYDMYNWIWKTYGINAAEWYLKTGKTGGNPYVPYGSYFPRASNPNQPPNPFAGAQDGDEFAFFWGKNKKPTTKTHKGSADAHAAETGLYPEMTPEKFKQKYNMTWQEYLNLPQFQY